MFIYLIVNHDTGKYYVGQHKGNNLRQYLQQKMSEAKHHLSRRSRLYASMRKHPDPKAWSIHALRSDIQTREELDQTERDFIKFIKAQDPEYGYNICRGGEGFTGPHSEETRKKISHASEEMWKDPAIRQIIISKNTGQKRPSHVGEIVRRLRLGVRASSETVKKLQESHMGLSRSKASRLKQSQSVSGTDNHFHGHIHSEATRVKMREAAKHKQYHRVCLKHGKVTVSHSRSKCLLCMTSQPVI